MSLAMSTALFLNTRTWSFPKLELQRKQKNSLLITFFRVSSMHRHGINIPLKKQEIIRRVPFHLYHSAWLADRGTITNRLLAYSNNPEGKCRLCLADVRGGEMNAWQTNPKGRLRGGYSLDWLRLQLAVSSFYRLNVQNFRMWKIQFTSAKTMISISLEEPENKGEKLRYMKLEVKQPKIK